MIRRVGANPVIWKKSAINFAQKAFYESRFALYWFIESMIYRFFSVYEDGEGHDLSSLSELIELHDNLPSSQKFQNWDLFNNLQ